MGVVDDIRQAVERLRDDRDRAAAAVSDVVGRLGDRAAGPTFAAMRRHNPIVTAGPVTIVTRNDDVREVLGDSERFTVDHYGPKMVAITGPFILGVDDTPLYRHDHAALDRAITAEDMPRLAEATYRAARELVAARLAGGAIDVVGELADPALGRVVADYMGSPGPDPETTLRWARNVFAELFINVGDLAAVRERALADAAQWRPHLDARIATRKAEIEAGREVPDDVLTRLLRGRDEGEPSLRDIAIRHNILGLVTGWLPTVSNAFARIVEELLEREDELERAQEAARAGDRELVAAYAFEASRFRPQNFALLRHVARDTTIAAGTERETAVRGGTTVFAATLSAMHDGEAVAAPGEFRVDRPWSDYMLFGHGLHTCYGQQIVRHTLPALAAALLEGPALRRGGSLRFEGPFPSELSVRFEER